MPAQARVGDPGIPHCGPYVIMTGSLDVIVNGRPAATVGSLSTPHLFPAGIIGIWEAWQYEKRGGKSKNKRKRRKPTTFAIFAAEEGSMEVESTASP